MDARAEPTCQELVELVTDYLEGALDPADRARFEAHLVDCEGCERYLAQVRITIRALRGAAAAPVEPVVRGRLLAAYRDWRDRAAPPGKA